MASPLTDFEKAQCLIFLGYSIFETNSAEIRAFNSLDNYPAAGDFIRPLIARIQQIDEEIMDAIPLAKAIKVGAEQLRVHYTIENLQRIGRIQVQRLAKVVKVKVYDDYFASAGRANNSGDSTFHTDDPSENRFLTGEPPRIG